MPHDLASATVTAAATTAATVFAGRAAPATRVLDVRALHARVLWDNGWGRARFPNFAAYLATIPHPPHHPPNHRFRHLVLVDTSLRLTAACRVLGIEYGGDDTVFDLFDNAPNLRPEVYWMWVQDGTENCGGSSFEARQLFEQNEEGLTAFEGVCFYALHGHVLTHHAVDLVRSRLGSFPAYVACLQLVNGQPTLGVAEYCSPSRTRGAASKWE